MSFLNLNSLLKKEIVLPSVRIQYPALPPQKVEIKLSNKNRDIRIKGNNLTVIGNQKTNQVEILGNNCTVRGVQNLEFFGKGGTIFATPKKDNFNINSDSSTKIYGKQNQDKIEFNNYISEEPGFFSKLKDDFLEGIASRSIEQKPFTFKTDTFVQE